MREIVHIQGGQAGNQIGEKFWELICEEHGILEDGKYVGTSPLQKQRINVYFKENRSDKFYPRAVCFDLEEKPIEKLVTSKYGGLFDSDNLISSHFGAGNIWAKGFHSEGRVIMDQVLDSVRRECEITDCLQGFQYCHSMGGGTGSGAGSLLLSRLQEEYSDSIISTFSIFPSTEASETMLEPYNSILCSNYLIEHATGVIMTDNEALAGICRRLDLYETGYEDMNRLLSMNMSGITCSMRYPGQLNCDLRKMCTNLIPFPRLHFFISSFSPLASKKERKLTNIGISFLTRQIFSADSFFANVEPTQGRYLTASVFFRGQLVTKEVDEHMYNVQQENSPYFCEWAPNAIKSSLCNIPPFGVQRAATLVANSTCAQSVFIHIGQAFSRMMQRKAFVHWYTNEGMEEFELSEAESNFHDLVSEYQQHFASTDDN